MEKEKKEFSINSTLQEFLDYLDNDYQLLNCFVPKHKYQYTYVCLDKKCLEQKLVFEPLCVLCQNQNPHGKQKDQHKVKEFVETLQEIIKLSFSNQNGEKQSQKTQEQYLSKLNEMLSEIQKIQNTVNDIVMTIKDEHDKIEKQLQENNIQSPDKQLKQLVFSILNEKNSKQLTGKFKQLNEIIQITDDNKIEFPKIQDECSVRVQKFNEKLVQSIQEYAKELGTFKDKIMPAQQNVVINYDELFIKSLTVLLNDQQVKPQEKFFLLKVQEQSQKVSIFSKQPNLIQNQSLNDINTQEKAVKALINFIGQPSSKQSCFYSLALVLIGLSYELGYGVEKNDSYAFKYYKASSDLGNSYGQYKTSGYYSQGIEVVKDFSMAFNLAKLSADQGNGFGLNAIGQCYEFGLGAQKDLNAAFNFYKLSAEEGNPNGQKSAGFCYENGQGTQKDLDLAFKFYKMSADQGYVIGQFNVGCCYFNGWGTQINIQQAIKYLQLSADQGCQEAVECLKKTKQYQ